MNGKNKRILITGANSYIGQAFESYAHENYDEKFQIDTLDMQDERWQEADFGKYDIVFHVAGIAHADIGKVTEEQKAQYYKVNTSLTLDVAQKAKAEGVGQFVFMSSMIIYGDSAGYGAQKIITKDTMPSPTNFYGDSKWKADMGVRELEDVAYKVTVLRPPMIYGKNSKGNYPLLAKLAKHCFVFPKVKNQRSMLHIDNLCEFLCQIMLQGKGGIFFPQNAEYTNTSEMVKEIAKVSGKRILELSILAPFVFLASKVPGKIGGLVNKAFGNMIYAQELSEYPEMDYRVVNLTESIQRTEGDEKDK